MGKEKSAAWRTQRGNRIVRMSSAAADRAFNLEAWLELEAFAFAAVEGRIQAKLARQELEYIKDESVAALFKADALLLPCIAAGR